MRITRRRPGCRTRSHVRTAALGSALLLLCAAPRTGAQTAAPALTRLGDLYVLVHRDNPRGAAARALARAAEARVSSAGLPPDPQLQFGLMNYNLPSLRPMEVIGMTQLQLMQMVPVAGKLGLSRRIAEAQSSAQAERASDVEWVVRSDVAMAFYELYQTDRGLAVARETLRLLQDIRGIAEAMYRVGDGRQTDVLRSQVEIARMVEDTVRMTTMRTGAAARLNALLNRAADASVALPALPAYPEAVPSVDSLVRLAESRRPMVRAGARDLEAANAQATLARREIWPDLTIGLQYGQQGGPMGTERMGSAMVGASVPIYAGRRQLRMREEANAMRQMAAADLTAMRADTRGRATESYANLMRARTLAALYRTTVIPQAQATVTSALASYRVGSVDFMTLLDDQMSVNRYRQELFTLEAEQGKAWADLEMLMGRELFNANIVAGTAATSGERD